MSEFKPTKPPLVCNHQAILEVKEALEGRSYERALSPNGTCEYRAPGGLRCAIGILLEGRIPEYSSAWSYTGGVKALITKEGAVREVLQHLDMSVLIDLQYIHDNKHIGRVRGSQLLQKLLNETPPIDV